MGGECDDVSVSAHMPTVITMNTQTCSTLPWLSKRARAQATWISPVSLVGHSGSRLETGHVTCRRVTCPGPTIYTASQQKPQASRGHPPSHVLQHAQQRFAEPAPLEVEANDVTLYACCKHGDLDRLGLACTSKPV